MPSDKSRVAIVDYQLANMFSVERACQHVGLEPVITSDPAVIDSADAVILPGVGAFGEAMAGLRRLGLVEPLRHLTRTGKPFMGICLGMQLLFSESEEFGHTEGLDIIPGRVVRFPAAGRSGPMRVPQIGWNKIARPAAAAWQNTPLSETPDGEFMYFLHSFYAIPREPEAVLCLTEYDGVTYASGVVKNNVFGLQFHPEKSAHKGLDIYKSFAKIISERAVNVG